ncbi:MAG TPA: GNAT family N-acetyltransferase [Saprospiraceae bacterium]|nr:GNAT family N-acetyltransferase [Saprospiraceae bacterium]
MKIFAETERLLLREIVPEDLDGFLELDSDPEVHRYLGNRPVSDKNKLLEIIRYVRQQYLDHGIGRWAVVEKSSNRFIGWSGLKKVTETVNHHINYYDLGYRLIRSHWGQGYATESARAALAYGFDQLQLKEIYAAAHSDNLASQNILTKVGFRFIETFDDDGAKHHWYKILRGQ